MRRRLWSFVVCWVVDQDLFTILLSHCYDQEGVLPLRAPVLKTRIKTSRVRIALSNKPSIIRCLKIGTFLRAPQRARRFLLTWAVRGSRWKLQTNPIWLSQSAIEMAA
jgi:hypothetical protein